MALSMVHVTNLKQQIMVDLSHLRSNMGKIPSTWQWLIIFIILLFFPYLIILWCLLVAYKYSFRYFFLILDVIILDALGIWPHVGTLYMWIKKCLFLLFFNPFFLYIPAFRKWLTTKLTFKNLKAMVWYVLIKLASPFRWLFNQGYHFLSRFLTFDLMTWWSQLQNRYNRYLWKRQEQFVKRLHDQHAERRLTAKNKLKRRTALQIKMCDIKLWYLHILIFFIDCWDIWLEETWFIYVVFLQIYFRCKYIWLFRFAYWGILKSYIFISIRDNWLDIKIDYVYCTQSFLNYTDHLIIKYALYAKFIFGWVKIVFITEETYFKMLKFFLTTLFRYLKLRVLTVYGHLKAFFLTPTIFLVYVYNVGMILFMTFGTSPSTYHPLLFS